jgi:RNA polymerase sigma factor (sigma-70 family)
MTTGSHGAALRQLRTLLERGSIGQLSDAELIDRFLSRGDADADAAFAALVERHGPAVFRVCRSVLRDTEAAHDAFQATFLVLVRKAGSVRVRDSIGPWLVAVAYRAASGARSAAHRRRVIERDAAEARASREQSDEDLAREVRAEVDRLADRYRRPILLCYFAGLTHEGAARQLGCPVGTVRSRLAWGRKQLRERLIRRGLVPSLAFGSLAAMPSQAAVPTTLLIRTARAASRLGAREAAGAVSAGAVVQAERVVRAMFMTKLKGIAAALLTLALVATGGGVLAQQEGNPESRFAAKTAQLRTQLDDNTYELMARYQKQVPPKVRPDVEIEMLLRAAREQEQAGHLDQALALTARMEAALHEWRTKLQPGNDQTPGEAPQNYIKRLVELPGEATNKNATPAQKPARPEVPFDGNQREGVNRQGVAAQQDARAKALMDVYTLHQPYTLQDNAKPGQKDAASLAYGIRPAEEARQMLGLEDVARAAVPFPETKIVEQPTANKLDSGNQKGRWTRGPAPTRAEIVALLDRKASLHLGKPTPLIEAVKLIQSAAGPDGALPIFFDLDGLQKANANLTRSVALDIGDAPLGVALKVLLDQVGLAYQVEDGRVVIRAHMTDPAGPVKP